MNRLDELTSGSSSATVTVHAVHDERADRCLFFMTRGPLETLRRRPEDCLRFIVGLQVPADSPAARIAYDDWVDTA